MTLCTTETKYPDADITVEDWSAHFSDARPEDTTNLFTAINEVVTDDGNYIHTSFAAEANKYICRIEELAANTTKLTAFFRANEHVPTSADTSILCHVGLTVSVYDKHDVLLGETTVANIANTFTDYQFDVAVPADKDGVKMQFVAARSGGEPRQCQVSQANLICTLP